MDDGKTKQAQAEDFAAGQAGSRRRRDVRRRTWQQLQYMSQAPHDEPQRAARAPEDDTSQAS